MRRLQMGMWHALDESRWDAYNGNVLNGLEICHYADTESLERLRSFCDRRGVAFGVHGPILGDRGYELPRVNSPDAAERREALARIAAETELASRYGADYLLFHYPFLPVFDTPIRRYYPKMPDPRARYGYDKLSRTAFRDVSERLFHELAELQLRYGQRIVLEHDFFGDYGDIVIDMFDRHPEIGFVVDTARLDVTRRAFDGFDPYEWLDRLAPSVYLVHYSNVRYEDDTFVHHWPVRASHDGDGRFGEAFSYLRHLAERNDAFHVTFEHKHEWVEREELFAIYRRAAEACGIPAGRADPTV
ncbi:sugar phosphate isomerase/epimerase family protein [Paenibacillus flagellatus]|uniref:Xylose isomerase n=1 Tax=Paenibacillus flagellatus TaxID=2211139 RepID=A0A2V5L2Z6_9BACL|nr:TIM barrel protein [Paenibacillus flagellatus]PYI57136.1 xylose isomerase [Paenibacillus flagellatus]